MAFHKLLKAFLIFLLPLFSFGQAKDTPPANWFNLDYEQDGVMGISTEKAYELLLKDKKSTPVVVAVIDGGVDVNHEDLKDIIWINEKDSASTGDDADGNGYINDKYGWNFLGNANGENVQYDNLEVTRLVRVLEPKYVSVLPTTPMDGEERREFQEYQKMVTYYANKMQEARFGQISYTGLKRTIDTIVTRIGKENPTLADFDSYRPDGDFEKMALRIVRKELKDKPDFPKFYEELEEGVTHFNNQVDYHLNKAYDSRSIVGDDYENSRERHYGNPDVVGPDAEHGTHVAGIIGAVRNNDIGIKGVADDVRIMVLRTVPDGDERDKDVANSIRYAVENGAKVINMSFGKAFAKDKQVVDDAVQFAMENDVLLVHAAGNEGQDNDANPNFPNRNYVDSLGINKGEADAWIEVGATSWKNDGDLLASFSNYGRRSVDVCAPGVDIHSTMPGSTYKDQQGTSMAAPVVAGLAALIRSYYPQLPAMEVKRIIMQSVTRVDQRVKITGPDGRTMRVSMNDVCVTGGIVNAYKALQLAAAQATESEKKK
ncbi:S8 family peptidase [Parapedobacter koreensis]|uniref:Subtilase family protein n=1 Tax=Parapedobacter koreensis TaxID=332977 RepID=A0A1H7SMY1_9SPHI|nr:S8 family peptidase [Parapedobacter koreensis]SEL73845.1 Subtilase family protein [Parapedobacter koreensis]